MAHSEKGLSPLEKYEQHFPSVLRALMEENGTTQKELAQFIQVRPQTLSLYCSGETQPNGEKLLKIAEFYHVTVDYLLTGTVIENIPVYKMLGFSENTVENLRLVKDGYFEDTPGMLAMLDCLLSDKDFYLAIEQACAWNAQKAGKAETYREFCEWKAAQYMQGYLLDFFSRDFSAIYKEKTE